MATMEEIRRKFIMNLLRRASLRWWGRSEALKRARVGRGLYKCAITGNVMHRKDIQLDHIIPVIDETVGWVSFDEYINRLFCPPTGFQVIAKEEHAKKTLSENFTRRKVLTKKKKKVKVKQYAKSAKKVKSIKS